MTILPDTGMTVWRHRRPGLPVAANVEIGAVLGDKTDKTPILH